MNRSDNELIIAKSLKIISEDEKFKEDLSIPNNMTFYSAVISHAYYSIFYAAKALLILKGIKTSSPDIHRKTYEEFESKFVNTGIIDIKLLEIYKNIIIKADTLLEIFKSEKWKRGNFTYNTLPQANKEPAQESINNSTLFVSSIFEIINKLKN
ncbi:MAG: HEPN domain-containing protein [Candidatus Nanoarchaeia archaeon]|nr:HEPN domain-containing protein [Candidatus Nanoarchaeia archaeon]